MQDPSVVLPLILRTQLSLCEMFLWLTQAEAVFDQEHYTHLLDYITLRNAMVIRLIPDASHPRDILHLSAHDAIIKFRFTIPEVQRICTAMRLPDHIVTDNRVKVNTVVAMAMLLRKLAWPSRHVDLCGEFGFCETTVSRILKTIVNMVYGQYERHIRLWPGLTQQRIRECADSITRFDSAVTHIWSFMDGTFKPVARPEEDQRASYSGYVRLHGQKYASIVTPDGMHVSCCGPFVGSRNDVTMFHESEIEDDLEALVVQGNETFMIYGDAAYKSEAYVMCPFINPQRNRSQREYNTFMAGLRVCVENAFGNTNQFMKHSSIKMLQRTGVVPTEAYHLLAVLFTNIRTTLYGMGGGAAARFDLEPPSLEEYLA